MLFVIKNHKIDTIISSGKFFNINNSHVIPLSRSVTTSVTIEVTNVNNSLICSPDNQSVNIPEDSKVNTVVSS